MYLYLSKHKDQILYAVEKNSVLICEAETGSGKSTQIAQYLAEAGYSEGDDDRKYMIAVTQPRFVLIQILFEIKPVTNLRVFSFQTSCCNHISQTRKRRDEL